LKTFDAVLRETPAAFATSTSLATMRFSSSNLSAILGAIQISP
jgi:hypothetical protein